MKISEVITILNDFKNNHGDLDCVTEDKEGWINNVYAPKIMIMYKDRELFDSIESIKKEYDEYPKNIIMDSFDENDCEKVCVIYR